MTQPVDNRRKLLWCLLGLQLLIGAAGVIFWRASAAPAPAPSFAVGVATPGRLPATLEDGAAVAWERARGWRAGARLLSATMQVDWPWDPPPGAVRTLPGTGWLTYVFVAPWEPAGRREEAASLTVLVERLSGEVVAQTTLGWETVPDARPDEGEPPVPSAAAVLVAEASGGTSFRRGCPQFRHLTRVALMPAGTLPTHWVVTYEDARQPARHGLRVRVDAASGAVLETAEEGAGCAEEVER